MSGAGLLQDMLLLAEHGITGAGAGRWSVDGVIVDVYATAGCVRLRRALEAPPAQDACPFGIAKAAIDPAGGWHAIVDLPHALPASSSVVSALRAAAGAIGWRPDGLADEAGLLGALSAAGFRAERTAAGWRVRSSASGPGALVTPELMACPGGFLLRQVIAAEIGLSPAAMSMLAAWLNYQIPRSACGLDELGRAVAWVPLLDELPAVTRQLAPAMASLDRFARRHGPVFSAMRGPDVERAMRLWARRQVSVISQ